MRTRRDWLISALKDGLFDSTQSGLIYDCIDQMDEEYNQILEKYKLASKSANHWFDSFRRHLEEGKKKKSFFKKVLALLKA